jgi:hypothetical protein
MEYLMGSLCGTSGGKDDFIQLFCGSDLKERGHMDNVEID